MLFVCNLRGCPLEKKPHGGPFSMCSLCRTKEAEKPRRFDKENYKEKMKKYRAKSYEILRKKEAANCQGKTQCCNDRPDQAILLGIIMLDTNGWAELEWAILQGGCILAS